MFDPAFYAEQARGLASFEGDLLDHYLETGWRLGLNPHRLFDTTWYAARYPESLANGLSPFVHFAINGATASYDPHPLFDSRWYVERDPRDVTASNEIPLIHYIGFGAREGRSPGPLFNVGAYEKAYPDVVNSTEGALIHFLTRWPLDNRPHGFDSIASESPHGVNEADWIAGLWIQFIEQCLSRLT